MMARAIVASAFLVLVGVVVFSVVQLAIEDTKQRTLQMQACMNSPHQVWKAEVIGRGYCAELGK